MVAVDPIVLGLLALGLVVSLAELGLSAYLAANGVDVSLTYYDAYDDVYLYEIVNISNPGQVIYLLFVSCWSLLVTGAMILIAFVLPNRNNSNSKALSIVTLVLTSFTMLHWLAGFAVFAQWVTGIQLRGTLAALLALAVIAWLIYLGLSILTFLTAAGVMKSERTGRGQLFGRPRYGQTQPSQTYMQPMQQQQPGAYKNGETVHQVAPA